MKKDKQGFFSRMFNSEHKIFETSMFSISVVISLALVVGIGYIVAVTFFNNDTITDEEANASSVTDGAITVTEVPDPTATPGDAVISDDDLDSDIDPDLATAEEGYTTADVNMRAEPSLTSSVVTKVSSGTKLTFLGIEEDEWMKVDYNGTTGYVNAMYLSVDEPEPIETVTPAPTEAPSTTAPKATKTPKVTKTPKATKTPKVTKTPKTTMTPTVTTEPTATAEPTQEPTAAPTATVKPTAEPTQDTTTTEE